MNSSLLRSASANPFDIGAPGSELDRCQWLSAFCILHLQCASR